jgi:hypothetical protein
MHVVPIHLQETLLSNRHDKCFHRPMVEILRWLHGFVSKINFHRVALIRSDSQAVVTQCEASLRVGVDNLLQHRPRQGPALGIAPRQQESDIHPALCIQLELKGLRAVTKHKAQELARLYALALFHL